MHACFGYNPISDKNKYLVYYRKCLSFLYESHTNMSVPILLTAVNLETKWCIHEFHRCHVDVFLQVTVLFQVDFLWNGRAGARADGRCFHHLPRSRQTSAFSVLIAVSLCYLQFCLWMVCLFYLAALRLIWGIMADINGPDSGELHFLWIWCTWSRSPTWTTWQCFFW